MVSGVKTEMPCCYPHKTSNITGNGAETVSSADRRRSESDMRLMAAKSKVSGKPRERERVCVSNRQRNS